jgi:hypothetical protein
MIIPSKHRRAAVAVPAALVLAAAVAGCGAATVSTGSFKGESHYVAARISSFQKHAEEANQQKLCSEDLAAALQQRINRTGTTCEAALKSQLKDVEDLTLNIKSIAVHGRTATAEVESTWSGKLRPATLKLVKEGEAWKISGL